MLRRDFENYNLNVVVLYLNLFTITLHKIKKCVGFPTFGKCILEFKKSQAEPSSEDNNIQKPQGLLHVQNNELTCLSQNSATRPHTVNCTCPAAKLLALCACTPS